MVSRIDNKSPQCHSAAGYDHAPSTGPPEPGRVIPARGIYGPAARLVITAEGCAEQAAWKSALVRWVRPGTQHAFVDGIDRYHPVRHGEVNLVVADADEQGCGGPGASPGV